MSCGEPCIATSKPYDNIQFRSLDNIYFDLRDIFEHRKTYRELIEEHVGKDARQIARTDIPGITLLSVAATVETFLHGTDGLQLVEPMPDAEFQHIDLGPRGSLYAPRVAEWKLQWQGIPVVLGARCRADVNDPDFRSIFVWHPKDKDTEALKLLDLVLAYAKEHSIYRNQAVALRYGHIPSFLNLPFVSDDELILTDEQRRHLEENVTVVLEHKAELIDLGLGSQRGLLLDGPPGTGKTLTGKWLWTKLQPLGFTFMLVSPAYFEYYTAVRQIFEAAIDLQPALIWLEDLDCVAADRSLDGFSRILGDLLTYLDGMHPRENVWVVATTNNAEIIDKALRNRPSRFDRRIQFELPGLDERVRLLRLFGKDLVDEREVFNIATQTKGFSGAHLKELVTTAVLHAFYERREAPTSSDWSYAIDTVASELDANIKKSNVGFGVVNSKGAIPAEKVVVSE